MPDGTAKPKTQNPKLITTSFPWKGESRALNIAESIRLNEKHLFLNIK
jgi:hypothetical protein